jgi:2,4-dienoyl-CoA reductase-like NADH-dependent reductase (Old Yellow Enzyme family)/thioredoxin reductase
LIRITKLLEPGRIGKLETRNRIVMPAMSSHGADENGGVTDTMIRYYEARAKGGVGLITVGSMCVDYPLGTSGMPRPAIDKDTLIPGLSKLVKVIHSHGAKAAAQIHHAGPAHRTNTTGLQPVAASAIIRPVDYFRPTFFEPRELSVMEIEDIITKFVKASVRAKEAGFDGIEIHGAHRYLINSFLSPYSNKRQDKYGGNLENRARFLMEIISAVRRVIGPDFPLWCKINARETVMKDGITLELTKVLVKMLENAGLDAILTSVYLDVQVRPRGYNMDASAEVKKLVRIPVIAVGRIGVDLGEQLLRQGKADFIAMGRGLLTDPDLPNKAASGSLDDIAPCVYCNNCMLMATGYHDFKCTVNAALNKELEYEIKPVEKSKKVLIVGGGPGGMEAARIAASRGHQVMLYEKERLLGGQLIVASILSKEYKSLNKYLIRQINKLGVKVELGKVVTPALVDEIKPNVVVIATGATSDIPEIPGIDRDDVLSGSDVYDMLVKGCRSGRGKGSKKFSFLRTLGNMASILTRAPFGLSIIRWVLGFWVPLGKRIIVVGKDLPGIELADFLVERGKHVVIVDARDEDLPYEEPPMPMLRHFLENRLIENGVALYTGAECQEITDKGLATVRSNGLRRIIKGDTVIFTTNRKPNNELYKALTGKPYEVHLIGDSAKPCGIKEAIHDGCRVGHAI